MMAGFNSSTRSWTFSPSPHTNRQARQLPLWHCKHCCLCEHHIRWPLGPQTPTGHLPARLASTSQFRHTHSVNQMAGNKPPHARQGVAAFPTFIDRPGGGHPSVAMTRNISVRYVSTEAFHSAQTGICKSAGTQRAPSPSPATNSSPELRCRIRRKPRRRTGSTCKHPATPSRCTSCSICPFRYPESTTTAATGSRSLPSSATRYSTASAHRPTSSQLRCAFRAPRAISEAQT
mmetsp:Transcript_24785/g.63186  ORF Transcript_24785/g.63186 Transcript_24785/m.63186 type:complete len:233 (-) Transcript_24785:746-1444(-)